VLAGKRPPSSGKRPDFETSALSALRALFFADIRDHGPDLWLD
jgi:hypothetical protein